MKRFFKIFAIAAIAVAAAIACVFAGCNTDSGKGSADYNFTIVYVGGDKDGKPVNGQKDGSNEGGKLATQICLPNGGCAPLTLANVYPDANGKLGLSQAQVNEMFASLSGVENYKDENGNVTEFAFHAIGVVGYKHDCEVEVNGKGNYELKIIVG